MAGTQAICMATLIWVRRERDGSLRAKLETHGIVVIGAILSIKLVRHAVLCRADYIRSAVASPSSETWCRM